jgi:hypothetical protein
VTCYTCHRGGDRPKVTPSLASLYGAAPPDEQDDVIEPAAPARRRPTKVLDKYAFAPRYWRGAACQHHELCAKGMQGVRIA